MKNKRIKTMLVGVLIGILIASTSVYAVIYYQSAEVGYDNTQSGSTSTNVQSALDELYNKYTKSPFSVGDYFTMFPSTSSYTIPSIITGYDSDQTISPSALTKWRVIKINSDNSVEAVSNSVSSTTLYFSGKPGYANFIGVLQTIATKYEKAGYTESARMMGFDNQTEFIPYDGAIINYTTADPTSGTGEEFDGGVKGDTLYLKDYLLVKNVYGSLTANKEYWLCSRMSVFDTPIIWGVGGRVINTSGELAKREFYGNMQGGASPRTNGASLRPIITLKSSVSISGGSGTNASPYTITNS